MTIVFKEFGVRLAFTPTVLGGDLINLKVKPEVSSLDFANGVSLSGFRVPALSTRRTETEVELQDGQTFAIAGLMNNTVSSTMSKIPGIGDIPILGYLFSSRAYQKAQTELVVMITPQIIRAGRPGVSQGLPSIVEPYLGTPEKADAAAGALHRVRRAIPAADKPKTTQRSDADAGSATPAQPQPQPVVAVPPLRHSPCSAPPPDADGRRAQAPASQAARGGDGREGAAARCEAMAAEKHHLAEAQQHEGGAGPEERGSQEAWPTRRPLRKPPPTRRRPRSRRS